MLANPFSLLKLDLPAQAAARLKEIEREILETKLDIAYRMALLDGLEEKRRILIDFLAGTKDRPALEGERP